MAGPHGRQAGSADCVDTLISCSPSEESASLYIYLHNTDGERVERERLANTDIAVRSLTCHTATGTHMPYGITSHSVSCHPAELTFPPLPQPKQVLD